VKTHAKPEIWSDRAHFEADAKQLAEKARSLVAAVESGNRDATKQAFGATGKDGCGACHDAFRTKLE